MQTYLDDIKTREHGVICIATRNGSDEFFFTRSSESESDSLYTIYPCFGVDFMWIEEEEDD